VQSTRFALLSRPREARPVLSLSKGGNNGQGKNDQSNSKMDAQLR